MGSLRKEGKCLLTFRSEKQQSELSVTFDANQSGRLLGPLIQAVPVTHPMASWLCNLPKLCDSKVKVLDILIQSSGMPVRWPQWHLRDVSQKPILWSTWHHPVWGCDMVFFYGKQILAHSWSQNHQESIFQTKDYAVTGVVRVRAWALAAPIS